MCSDSNKNKGKCCIILSLVHVVSIAVIQVHITGYVEEDEILKHSTTDRRRKTTFFNFYVEQSLFIILFMVLWINVLICLYSYKKLW